MFVIKNVFSKCFKNSTGRFILKRNKMDVVPLEALSDNYMYFIIDRRTRECAVVDPVDPDRILAFAQKEKLQISKILTTHHHSDHAGGNAELYKMLNDASVPVYGGDDRIPALTHKARHDDKFTIGSLNVRCLFTPCHTTGHICYFVEANDEEQQKAVFTGDTLFIAGCGRFFEGTPEQMYNALVNVLAALPKTTKVFCGHEYTVSNLKFAHFVEPGNENVKRKLEWALKQREAGLPTVPSTIEDELTFNPFMRVREESVQAHAKSGNDAVKCMEVVRREKDVWKAA